jgi:5-methylcytosine-specific restriction enzyme subunit McrC
MNLVTVREFARLTTDVVTPTLDRASVSASAFDWLCKESARLRISGASLVQVDDRRWLRLDNYVGVVETPCGTRIEILPKHVDDGDASTKARALLKRMLLRCLDVNARESSPTALEAFDGTITEWVMHRFLQSLDHLVKRGMRFEYQSVQEQQRFLRGRLDVARQLRQPPGRQHLFQIEHDIFSPDRAENRLIRSALDRIRNSTNAPDNWRLAHELAELISAIPPSADIQGDFRRWHDSRLMTHYRPIRPWCALILNEQSPLSILGQWHGTSLLFPMERLFERYVERCIRQSLPTGAEMIAAPASHYLCQHGNESWFRLKPDLMIKLGSQKWTLDIKWKRLDATLADGTNKYGLSQADFYQIYAYGHRYQNATGNLFLIYPRTSDFPLALPEFKFVEGMTLHVLPFDLDSGRIVGATLAMRLHQDAARQCGENLELTRGEVAFCDALATNESTVPAMERQTRAG